MEMTLDKKQIRAIFLLTCNINNIFGLGTPNEQCGGGSVSFVKIVRAFFGIAFLWDWNEN